MRNKRLENENSEFEAGEHRLNKLQMLGKATTLEQTVSYLLGTLKENTSQVLEIV